MDKTVLHRDRPAIIEHVKALARLSSAKRTAVLTLTATDGMLGLGPFRVDT